MKHFISSYLTHPLSKDIRDIDSPEMTRRRLQIIQSKPFLLRLYTDWYRSIKLSLPENVSGPLIEIGSGAGFMKSVIPEIITSDLFSIPNIDVVLDAVHFPFFHDSLRGIVMIDVLHHIPDVSQFFKQAQLCLKKSGVMIMIEPWITTWSTIIYTYFHHEPIDTKTASWTLPPGGPLSQANSALPWIVFHRDRKRFLKEFPQLQIKNIQLHTPFLYLLSGGVSLKNLTPEKLYPLFNTLEHKIKPFMHQLAMFATIILEKK